MKISKEAEVIKIRGYMGKVEEAEGKRIDLSDLDLYLVKSSKYYSVYEKNTGKSVIPVKKTRKEILQSLEEILNTYSEKLKELIQSAIEKDGNIKEYDLGKWIR